MNKTVIAFVLFGFGLAGGCGGNSTEITGMDDGAAGSGAGGSGSGLPGCTDGDCSACMTCFESCTCEGTSPTACLDQCTGSGASGGGPSAGGSGGTAGPGECGNGVVDTGEMCDGSDLAGETCSSATMNMRSVGTLSCSASCTFDTTGCGGDVMGGAGAAGTTGTGGSGAFAGNGAFGGLGP